MINFVNFCKIYFMDTKIRRILISCLIILALLVGGSLFLIKVFNKNETKVKDLVIKTQNINLEVGEQINLENYYTILPSTSKAIVMCIVADNSYAKISTGNILTAKHIGKTQVLLKVDAGSNNFIERNINVEVNEKSCIPTALSFEKEVVNLNLQSKNITNKLIVTGKYNVTPIITYSSNNICNYNYKTGIITPLNYGQTTITVSFSNNDEIISKSFIVNVIDEYRKMEMNLEKDGNYYILKTNSNKIEFLKVLLYEQNQIVKKNINADIISNNNGLEIIQNENCDIIIITSDIGESIIKFSCKEDESVYIYVKIIVEN